MVQSIMQPINASINAILKKWSATTYLEDLSGLSNEACAFTWPHRLISHSLIVMSVRDISICYEHLESTLNSVTLFTTIDLFFGDVTHLHLRDLRGKWSSLNVTKIKFKPRGVNTVLRGWSSNRGRKALRPEFEMLINWHAHTLRKWNQ